MDLGRGIRRLAPLIVSQALVEYGLGKLNKAFPMIVFSLLETKGSGLFAAILRELLAESVSVRDYRLILDTLLSVEDSARVQRPGLRTFLPHAARLIDSWDQKALDQCTPCDYADCIRIALRDTLVRPNDGEHVWLHPLRADQERKLLEETPEQWEPARCHALLSKLAGLDLARGRHAVLTSTSCARRQLRSLIEIELPDLSILCRSELGGDIQWRNGTPIDL